MQLPHSASPSQQAIDRIVEMQRATPRFIIAIDGLGGAGKSSLARSIVASVPEAKHFEYDWFHLPKAEVRDDSRYDYSRLQREVLEPFRQGQRSFEFLRYNWGYLSGSPDGFAAEPVRVSDVDILVLEGCGVLTPILSECYDIRIWVDTPAEEALARGTRRDIEEYGLDPDKVTSAWAEWTLWEAEALRRDNRRLRAALFV